MPVSRARGGLLAAALFATAFALPASLVAQDAEIEEPPIRISSNENAFGFSEKALKAMLENADRANYYNRDEVAELINVIVDVEGVKGPEWVLPTPGSGPVLEMTAIAYADPDKKLITAMPGYPQLVGAWKKFGGGEVVYVPVDEEMKYDFDAMREAIDEDTGIVYICNPNNPTGTLADPMELRQFVLSVPADVMVFVDEAYIELSDSGLEANSIRPLLGLRKNLILSRTFSKAYGLAGARAGYGVAHPDVLDKLRFYDFARGPNFLSAIAAREALLDQEHMDWAASMYQKARNMVTGEFEKMGIAYVPPQGAFIMFDTGMDAGEFREIMFEKYNIRLSRPFPPYPDEKYNNWARVSIGSMEEMEAFVEALKDMKGADTVAMRD
ncbi:MAG: pyridoxal phosphate-dependent aminotransferase [Verrucomicrobiota bacterium]